MVAPRLAGQRAQYILSQIGSFAEHTRDNPFSKQYMWGAVAALHPYEARDLAIYFSALPPKPANDGDRNLAARGRTIYMEGIPEANIVSCYACHGPNAEGIRDIPRLGGLAYFYLKGAARTVEPRISFRHRVADADQINDLFCRFTGTKRASRAHR